MPRPTDRLAALEQIVDDLILGAYRTPTGPGTIRGKSIKPKSITANLVNVSSLEAVNTKTGNLSVTGGITMEETGATFSAGQSAYNTGSPGWFLEWNAGTPRFSLGNPSGNRLTWNGTTLAITGSITADAGEIGGFTIGATDLTTDAGATGLASSGSQRIWVGHATPSSAPFRVSSAGVATMIGAVIGSAASGARVELNPTNGVSVYDSGGTVRGRLLTTGAGYLGSTDGTSATAALSWTTAGAATINASAITTGTLNAAGITVTNLNAGSITAGTLVADRISGGSLGGSFTLGTATISIPSGGKIVDADGSEWNSSGIILKSAGAFGDTIKWQVSGADKGSIYASVNDVVLNFPSGGSVYAGSSDAGIVYGGGSLRAGTAYTWGTAKHYPGYGTNGQQFTYYIEGGGAGAIITNGIGIGGMLGISSGNTINLIAPGTGGSATNWSGFTTANIPDKSAGYFIIQLGGTAYRVPFYANA